MMMDANIPPAKQDHRPVRVLIVDDSPQVQRDLRQFLDLTDNIEVVAEAADGQEAVRLAAALSPDVIVMDLEMPGMDGFEATRQIKAQATDLRIVVLSMHSGPESVEKARLAGADEFVAKGASFELLINAILGRNDPPDLTNSSKGTQT